MLVPFVTVLVLSLVYPLNGFGAVFSPEKIDSEHGSLFFSYQSNLIWGECRRVPSKVLLNYEDCLKKAKAIPFSQLRLLLGDSTSPLNTSNGQIQKKDLLDQLNRVSQLAKKFPDDEVFKSRVEKLSTKLASLEYSADKTTALFKSFEGFTVIDTALDESAKPLAPQISELLTLLSNLESKNKKDLESLRDKNSRMIEFCSKNCRDKYDLVYDRSYRYAVTDRENFNKYNNSSGMDYSGLRLKADRAAANSVSACIDNCHEEYPTSDLLLQAILSKKPFVQSLKIDISALEKALLQESKNFATPAKQSSPALLSVQVVPIDRSLVKWNSQSAFIIFEIPGATKLEVNDKEVVVNGHFSTPPLPKGIFGYDYKVTIADGATLVGTLTVKAGDILLVTSKDSAVWPWIGSDRTKLRSVAIPGDSKQNHDDLKLEIFNAPGTRVRFRNKFYGEGDYFATMTVPSLKNSTEQSITESVEILSGDVVVDSVKFSYKAGERVMIGYSVLPIADLTPKSDLFITPAREK